MARLRSLAALPLAALALCLAGCDSADDCTGPSCTDPDARPVEVASTREVGAIGKPAAVAGRDGVQSVALGGQVLWIFGDTFYSTQSVDGTNYRTATATLADLATPLVTAEPLDANGIPFAALAWTDAERAYNAASGNGSDRVALWNAGLVPDAARGTALAFYEKLYTKPSGWTAAGIGTARFSPGQTTGTRAPGLLFNHEAGEPLFKWAMLHDGLVYLYGVVPGGGGVARAPLDRAESRSAYTFWDGRAWTADISKVAPLTGGVPGDLSVAWNAYLGQFVGVYAQPFGTAIVFRTAPRPEGPWSAARPLFATRAGANGQPTYVGAQHPALARDGGQTIAVTYSLPTDCFLCGEVILTDVTFR